MKSSRLWKQNRASRHWRNLIFVKGGNFSSIRPMEVLTAMTEVKISWKPLQIFKYWFVLFIQSILKLGKCINSNSDGTFIMQFYSHCCPSFNSISSDCPLWKEMILHVGLFSLWLQAIDLNTVNILDYIPFEKHWVNALLDDSVLWFSGKEWLLLTETVLQKITFESVLRIYQIRWVQLRSSSV